MGLSVLLLPEFDHEMANTRKTLERIPEDRLGWKPHVKSWTMGDRATHLAIIPIWTVHTIEEDSLDLAPPGAPPYEAPRASSRKEVLQMFDKNVAAARAAIAGASDEHLMKPWTLLSGGKTGFTMRRMAVLRSFILKSQHPPSRAARRVFPAERRARSCDLRPFSRRRWDVASILERFGLLTGRVKPCYDSPALGGPQGPHVERRP